MSGQHHHLGASASRGRRRVDSGTVNSSEMAKNFSVATAIPQPEPALAAAGSGSAVMASRGADVGKLREHLRQRRLAGLAVSLGTLLGYLIWRAVHAQPAWPGMPHIDWMIAVPILFFVALLAVLLGTTVVAGRSPHLTYRPDQIEVSFADVAGVDPVKDEVVRSLNLFLAAKSFRDSMGGSPRRGLLFEGSPGTGKTHMAKAMAREAGVPFLFVSATSFQSMYYGATSRKIRSYFKQLRKAARKEGGAIGFIEEIDAIAMARGGVRNASSATTTHGCAALAGLACVYNPSVPHQASQTHASITSEGVGGVVNELLVQMQSFDEPSGWQKLHTKTVDALNLYLPAHRQIPRPRTTPTNVLLIAATNRAADLDPALLRPGRFDRRLSFELPDQAGRLALLEVYLARKAHDSHLDDPAQREQLASLTSGYSPARLVHLLDEALVFALRRGAGAMSWADVEQARLVEEVGLGQPVAYTPRELRLIATHEAGHATVAWLQAPTRRLEVVTVIKRGQALGLLAHGDAEEVYTRTRTELTALVRIALAGQCAEELFFGDVTTGPGSDLAYATSVSADMLGSCGMGDSLISYAAVQGSAFSSTNVVGQMVADAQGRRALEEFLQQQRDYVRELLRRHRHCVQALADALVQRHELYGSQITDVLEAAAQEATQELPIDELLP